MPKLLTIRRAGEVDKEWIASFLRERWRGTTIAVHGETIDAAALPALIAGEHQGLATYRRESPDAELVTLDAEPVGTGIGTALVEALVTELSAANCTRLWLTTTNDKLSALRFYMRRRFRLIQVRPGAIEAARRLKPSIPTIGEHGIPMHDEVDLCRTLEADREEYPILPPWSRAAAAAPDGAR
jgi:GNAT superfamily N-acetyltransferase